MDIFSWPWREASLLHPTIDVRVLTGIVCLVVTLSWWSSRHRQTAPANSNGEHENGCNNPNCLRCHSSSRHHVDAFRANVTMLRRLVKLEPDLFEGMRESIWSAIEDVERKFDRPNDIQPGMSIKFRILMQECWIRWQNMNSDATIKSDGTHIAVEEGASCSSTPLSPQQGQTPTVFFLPGLEAIPLHDANRCMDKCPCGRLWKSNPIRKEYPPIPVTGDVEALQNSYHIIRQELLDFLSSHQLYSDLFKPFDPKVYTHASTAIGQNSDMKSNTRPEWSSIYLYHQGIRQSETCNKHFPQTAQILETKCPHVMAGKCGFGSVYFSKLERGTKVKEHCGPTNVRWRCHLPLVVPKTSGVEGGGSCLCAGLPGVNEKRVEWEEGVPLLFDDSFLHSAVHRGYINADESNSDPNANVDMGGARVVLIVDFWHPILTDADRTALGVLYPPGS